MDPEDPFGAPEDESERTVIRPNPGGRRPTPGGAAPAAGPGAAEPPPRAAAERELPKALQLFGVNALAAAAAPILHLAVRLKGMASHDDVAGLHARVVAEIRTFERRATEAGFPPETVRAARYALAATVDDLVLNTPWGSASQWTRQSMVSTFHKETFGGERFFELLEAMSRDPSRNLEMLELLYLCLALGFEGQYRVTPRGAAERDTIQSSLYRTIRLRRGDFERDLSPHWRGVESRHKSFHAQVPLWVIGAVTAVLLTLMYVGFSFALNRASDDLFASIGNLPPAEPFKFERPPPPPPPETKQSVGLKDCLADAIKAGLVTVLQDADTVTVRIAGTGMFASGSDQIEPRFTSILVSTGNCLNDKPGKVLVAGYTDNVPIRTLRFPSNWQLSVARAQSVERQLKALLKDPSRLSTEGFGETHPLASNATPQGREANRRIEIVLTPQPEAGPSAAALPAKQE